VKVEVDRGMVVMIATGDGLQGYDQTKVAYDVGCYKSVSQVQCR